jgi:hypothetical protein
MPNHASHHNDGAGKARDGSAPTTDAAARPDHVRSRSIQQLFLAGRLHDRVVHVALTTRTA